MEYRKLGESDLKCSVITFGAWAIGGWMWGGADRKEAINAIQSAYEHGVTSFDTAPVYGQGLSEEILAEALQGIPRNKVQILTKFGLRWEGKDGEYYFSSKKNDGTHIDVYRYAGKESIIKECETSLKILKTDYIDLYQQHWADSTTPVAETMEALIRLQERGKIRYAGVCNYSKALFEEANKTISLVSDQVPYSMVLRDIEDELVPYVIENKKSIIAYSPLQRGLLTGKIKPGHQFNEGDTREGNRFYSNENIQRINVMLDTLRPLAESKGASVAQLVLRWTIEQPGITIALAGARNTEQAVQNAGAVNFQLTIDEMELINKEIASLQLAAPEKI